MTPEEIRDYWIVEADEARQVAQHLFDKKDYSYSLFFGHLAVEKLLKAIYTVRKNEQAPRIHNLGRLAKEAGITLDSEQQDKLIRITAFNLETRYPDYKRGFRKKCTRDFTTHELAKIDKVLQWLRSII